MSDEGMTERELEDAAQWHGDARTPNTGDERDREVEAVARLFHETYERLAPEFSYETRKASAVPWEHVPLNNRALMRATVAEVLARVSPSRDGTVAVEDVRDVLLRIGERVMTFGGFQRTPRGEFWVARDDVLRLVDELLDEFGVSERTERIHDQATKEAE